MFERQLIFLEVVLSIVNPVNKLYSLAYKFQQTFFVPAIKTWISEQHHTSNVFYSVKMRNLSLVSIWSLRSLRKKSSAIAVIIAIIRKPPSSDRNDNDRWDIKSSMSVIVACRSVRWKVVSIWSLWWWRSMNFFFSQWSQRSSRSYGKQALSRSSCVRE